MIIGINDTHGALLAIPPPRWASAYTKSDIGGADWFAGWVNAIRADYGEKGDEVLIVDAGDEFQGTLISNEFRGKSVVDVYNAIGVTASAVGNHEFDFGMPVLKERIAQARYPILAANIFLKGTRNRPDWVKPSALVDAGGIKVGIVGLATVETPVTTNPVNISDLEFAEGGPLAAAEADRLRAQGATVMIITAHAGPFPPDNEIEKIAEACKGKVDAIVSGHHHTLLSTAVANIPIVQSGAKLSSFSTIELTLDAQGHVKQYVVNEGNVPKAGAPQPILHTYNGRPAEWRGHEIEPDARVAAILGDYDLQVKKLRESRIGATAVELRKGGNDDLLANLAADAMRSGAGGGLKANFAFQNSGVRSRSGRSSTCTLSTTSRWWCRCRRPRCAMRSNRCCTRARDRCASRGCATRSTGSTCSPWTSRTRRPGPSSSTWSTKARATCSAKRRAARRRSASRPARLAPSRWR